MDSLMRIISSALICQITDKRKYIFQIAKHCFEIAQYLQLQIFYDMEQCSVFFFEKYMMRILQIFLCAFYQRYCVILQLKMMSGFGVSQVTGTQYQTFIPKFHLNHHLIIKNVLQGRLKSILTLSKCHRGRFSKPRTDPQMADVEELYIIECCKGLYQCT